MNEQTHKAIECARQNRANGIRYGHDEVIVDLVAELDRLAEEEAVNGPSIEALIGHHLTQAIRHLSAAAEFARELSRADAGKLVMSLERAVEAARDIRGDVESPSPRK